MRNERVRLALVAAGWTPADLAGKLGVDPKTVERWIRPGRTPHRRTAYRAAALLGVDPAELWPDLERTGPRTNRQSGLVTLYPSRADVPSDLWLRLLRQAQTQIDLLVYAGQFLPESNLDWLATLAAKAEQGARVRAAFGDPNSSVVIRRGEEEGVGAGMAARIRTTLVWYRGLLGSPGAELVIHDTTLYNSIYRFDDDMLVNTHIYGNPAFRSPVLHLRRMSAGSLFEEYVESFERVWATGRQIPPLSPRQ